MRLFYLCFTFLHRKHLKSSSYLVGQFQTIFVYNPPFSGCTYVGVNREASAAGENLKFSHFF